MSQPLRSAYITIVIAVQEARHAVSRRVGEGACVGAAVLLGLVDDERVAVHLDVVEVALRRGVARSPSARRRALEQRRVVDVGEAGHRVDEVGGPVEVAQHRVRGEALALAQRDDAALGAAQDRRGRGRAGPESGVPPGITNFGGRSTRSM